MVNIFIILNRYPPKLIKLYGTLVVWKRSEAKCELLSTILHQAQVGECVRELSSATRRKKKGLKRCLQVWMENKPFTTTECV